MNGGTSARYSQCVNLVLERIEVNSNLSVFQCLLIASLTLCPAIHCVKHSQNEMCMVSLSTLREENYLKCYQNALICSLDFQPVA